MQAIDTVKRLGKNIKMEVNAALDQITCLWDNKVIDYDRRVVIDTDEDVAYQIEFYRNEDELIAVPCFYMMEGDGSTFRGSRGGEYVLYSETLYIEE